MGKVVITSSAVNIDHDTLGALSADDFKRIREAIDVIGRILLDTDKITGEIHGSPDRQQARQLASSAGDD